MSVLDLGSSSFQLALFAIGGSTPRLLHRGVEFARLASHLRANGEITARGIANGVACVQRLMSTALPQSHQAPLVAVATGAIRESTNGQLFLDTVQHTAGVRAHVISGESEATLAYTGAAAFLDNREEESRVVVDLGGGSTEIALGVGRKVIQASSVNLGVLDIVERLASMPNTANLALEQLAVFVRRSLEPTVDQLSPTPTSRLIFASGVARVIRDLIHTYTLNSEDDEILGRTLRDLIPKILDSSPDDLRRRGVPEKRLQSAGPTAVVLNVIADLLEADRFTVSDGGLRQGVALNSAKFVPQSWPKPDSS